MADRAKANIGPADRFRPRPVFLVPVLLALLGAASAAQAAATGVADSSEAATVPVAPTPETLQDADEWAASGVPARINVAIAWYEAHAEPQNAEWQWRMAKAWFHLYDELPQALRSDRTAAAERSEAHGERAVELDPDGIESRYWYSQGLLAVADMKGPFAALRRIRRVQGRLEPLLHEAPGIDDAGPDRFFAILNLEAPWPIGNNEKARLHAERAFELAPDRCANVFVAAASRIRTGEAGLAEPLVDRLARSECRASSPYWLELYRTQYVEKLRKGG